MKNKNILVVTHERSGTHLVINIINIKNNGDFIPIGKLPKYETIFTLENYIKYVKRHTIYSIYESNLVFKSHHQIQFFEPIIEKLFDNFKVIYVKRDIKDVLISYYKFLNGKGFDENGNSKPIENFPEFKNWIFMKPCDVGYKYFEKHPDPHIFIEPEDYIERLIMHECGWMKYKDKILTINYEDVLNNFSFTKKQIENFINKKIADEIPNLHDKKLPNFSPNKGIVGSHIEVMNDELIQKIENRATELYKKYENL